MPRTAAAVAQLPAELPYNPVVSLLVRALRPLVLLMLRRGMTAYEFAEVSRWVFAQVAMDRRRFAVRGRDVWSMTKSRAAVLTGLTRREVDRLVGMRMPAVDEARMAYHRGARILAAWASDCGYQDRAGKPRDLPIKGAEGSLDCLVRKYCRDIPVRAMLDDLESRGCVVRLNKETVRFVHTDFATTQLAAEEVEMLSQYAGHFMAAIEGRLDAERQPRPGFIEISAIAVAPDQREMVRERIAAAVETFAGQMNRELATFPKPLMSENAGKMMIGVYHAFLDGGR